MIQANTTKETKIDGNRTKKKKLLNDSDNNKMTMNYTYLV